MCSRKKYDFCCQFENKMKGNVKFGRFWNWPIVGVNYNKHWNLAFLLIPTYSLRIKWQNHPIRFVIDIFRWMFLCSVPGQDKNTKDSQKNKNRRLMKGRLDTKNGERARRNNVQRQEKIKMAEAYWKFLIDHFHWTINFSVTVWNKAMVHTMFVVMVLVCVSVCAYVMV